MEMTNTETTEAKCVALREDLVRFARGATEEDSVLYGFAQPLTYASSTASTRSIGGKNTNSVLSTPSALNRSNFISPPSPACRIPWADNPGITGSLTLRGRRASQRGLHMNRSISFLVALAAWSACGQSSQSPDAMSALSLEDKSLLIGICEAVTLYYLGHRSVPSSLEVLDADGHIPV